MLMFKEKTEKKHKNEKKNLKKKNLMGLRQFKVCIPSHMRWELRWDSFHNVLLKRAFLRFQHSEHTKLDLFLFLTLVLSLSPSYTQYT